MTALLLGVLASSLLGSLHCAGMCGGFVALHSGAPGRRPRAPSAPLVHGAYSAGRALAYVTLGTTAGALGGTLDDAGVLAGVQRLAALVAGLLVVAWGLAGLGRALGLRAAAGLSGGVLDRLAADGVRLAAGSPAPVRALVTGLLAGVLPCGWLWAFVLTAAGTGSAATGALVMLVFWVGTLPMLAGVGVLLETVGRPLRRNLPAVTAVAMIAVGLLAVAGRTAPLLPRDAGAPSAPTTTGASSAHARH